jgi:uncharacterized protein YjbJ (UPF0337 family)
MVDKKKVSQSVDGKVTEAKGAAAGTADAAKSKVQNAFSDLKGDVSALLKGLKDSLGIPDLPKFPKKSAFKQLKKFEPKKAPEPKAFQKEEKKFEFAQAAPITPPPPKPPVDPRANFVEEYKGYKIYLLANLPNFYMESRLNDGPVSFKGPESRSATKAELLAYQKKVIDEATSQ